MLAMNIPISITLLRIAAIPLVALFYLIPFHWAHVLAAFVFLIAALSDWLDGFLARALSQTTDFGAFLDPVADKLLVSVSLVFVLGVHPMLILAIPAAIIIGREIAISALREWMAELGKRAGVRVTFIGKLKTVLQMAAIFILLWYTPTAPAILKWLGPLLLWIAAGLTVWSMIIYIKLAWPDLGLSKVESAQTPENQETSSDD